MPDFSHRSTMPELMDTEETGYEDFRQCLRHLALVNRLTLAHRPTLDWLERAIGRAPGRPLNILDAGSGYGDMLRAVHRWAARRGVEVRLTGIDLNRWSADAAREATPAGAGIDYVTGDLFAYQPSQPPDIILSSLFAHHLDDAALVRFLRWMDATARIGWFVNDLRRSRAAHALFGVGTALAPWHRFIRQDGLTSITRAFVEEDWKRLLQQAGIADARAEICRRFPYRLCVGAFTSG